jgi:hypothetical protein
MGFKLPATPSKGGKGAGMSTTISLNQFLHEITASLRLTDADLAGAMQSSPRTIERWRAQATFPQHEARRRLDALDALAERLRESLETPEAINAWMHSDNGYLGGLKPIEALRAGRIDRVEAAIEALDSGIFV